MLPSKILQEWGGLPVFFVSLFRCLARFPLPLNLQSYNFQGFLLEFVGCVRHFWYIYLNQGNPQGRKIYLLSTGGQL